MRGLPHNQRDIVEGSLVPCQLGLVLAISEIHTKDSHIHATKTDVAATSFVNTELRRRSGTAIDPLIVTSHAFNSQQCHWSGVDLPSPTRQARLQKQLRIERNIQIDNDMNTSPASWPFTQFTLIRHPSILFMEPNDFPSPAGSDDHFARYSLSQTILDRAVLDNRASLYLVGSKWGPTERDRLKVESSKFSPELRLNNFTSPASLTIQSKTESVATIGDRAVLEKTIIGRHPPTMSSAPHGHTIHMTPAESDRIRSTVQTRLQKCRDLRGQPRTPRDPKAAVSEAKQAGFMADMSGSVQPGMSVYSGRDNIVALAVGSPYPPCMTPVEQLKGIPLGELQMDTHHRGRVLHVKGTGPVVPLIAYSWTVVEDEAGDAERLEVYLHKSKRGEDLLESAREFWILEPYFTINEQGEATIRVHHPSDIVRVKDRTAFAKTAEKCKEKGNAALKRKEFVEAAEHYAEGLRLCDGEDEKGTRERFGYDLHRNRAHVNLILNRWDEAKADGMAAITGRTDEKSKALDSKANFRAGSAAYALGEFEEAKKLFEAALSLAPDDKEAKIYLRNIETRLHEQQTGAYDFTKIRSRISPAKSRVDAANFTARTEARESPLGGRGLFATKDIKKGEIVLCEKAFCVVWSHEAEAWSAMTYDARDDQLRVFPAGMSQVLAQKLLNNPSQIPRVMDLFGDHRSDDTTPPSRQQDLLPITASDGPVMDTFQLHDIICRNAFGPGAISSFSSSSSSSSSSSPSTGINDSSRPSEDILTASTGLWIAAAHINHSCLPNASKEYWGDLIILRANAEILRGEEITHAYCGGDDDGGMPDWEARRRELWRTWGFECPCRLCEAERGEGEAVRGERQELRGKIAAFLERERGRARGAKRVVVAEGERLVRRLEGTYEGERWEGLPRWGLEGMRAWVEEARKGRGGGEVDAV
ncbi:hypothetical protein BST61_g10247 [Cercospora zeina]